MHIASWARFTAAASILSFAPACGDDGGSAESSPGSDSGSATGTDSPNTSGPSGSTSNASTSSASTGPGTAADDTTGMGTTGAPGSDSTGGGGQVCAEYMPCGGDIVGTWTLSDGCAADPTSPISNCPESTYDVIVALEGTSTFNEDMTFSQTGTQSADYHAEVPATCMKMLDITTCDDLLTDVFGDVGTCVDAADGCTCDGPFLAETAIDASGTWDTSDNDFTFDIEGVGPVPGTYCVEGNTFLAAAAGSPFINVAVME